MESSLIEQYDKSRYNFVKWLTIGWAAWFGSYILKDFLPQHLISAIVITGLIGLIGLVFFVINLHKYMRLASKIKYSRLKDALNSEMYQLFKYKSAYFGLKVTLGTILVLFVFSHFYTISGLLVCEIALYFGILSTLIAGLLYQKD